MEPFLAKNGGPIVLLQLENEYGPANLTDPYFKYVADLATSLDAKLPFLWCEGTTKHFQNCRKSSVGKFMGKSQRQTCICAQAQPDST